LTVVESEKNDEENAKKTVGVFLRMQISQKIHR